MTAAPGTVVTGDAVVLDIQIAQLPVRAVGALIDVLVISVGLLLATTLWAMTLREFDDALSAAVLIVLTVVVIVGYPIAMETATRGRSLGKMVMGLRVVSDDGGPERFRQAVFRSLSGFVEIWMFVGGPAVIASLISPSGKRIGDMFAGTVVISERGPKPTAPPVMPPALAWWASSLELSALDPDRAELARQFLIRAPQLDPGVRTQMAYRVTSEVVMRISPPPPPGAPPEQVLAAVLCERHRRDVARLRPAVTVRADPPPVSPSGPPVPPHGGLVPPD